MKIFIVWSRPSEPYEPQSIWAVFDSREKAEAWVKENHYDWYKPEDLIDELEINKATLMFEWNNPRKIQ
jgi:hypothetical protein